MLTGLAVAGLSSAALGAFSYLENSSAFLGLSLAMRLVQGTGCITMRILCTPLAVISFPALLNTIFVVFAFVVSASIFLSPVLGGLLAAHGVSWPFFALSAVQFFFVFPFFLKALPLDSHLVRLGATGLAGYRSDRRLPTSPESRTRMPRTHQTSARPFANPVPPS